MSSVSHAPGAKAVAAPADANRVFKELVQSPTLKRLVGLKKGLIAVRVLQACIGIIVCVLAAVVVSQAEHPQGVNKQTPSMDEGYDDYSLTEHTGGGSTAHHGFELVFVVMAAMGAVSAIHAIVCIALDATRGTKGYFLGLYVYDILGDVMLVIFWAAWFTLTVLDDDDDGGVMTGLLCLLHLTTMSLAAAVCSELKACVVPGQKMLWAQVSPV